MRYYTASSAKWQGENSFIVLIAVVRHNRGWIIKPT